MIIEPIAQIGIPLETVITFLLISVNAYQVVNNLHFYQLYIVVDGILVVIVIHYNISKVALTYKTVLLVSFSWFLHIGQVSKEVFWSMKSAFLLSRKSISGTTESSRITFIWSVFMREHSLLLIDLINFNKHFDSTLIFWHYTPVIISTIYCFCLLYFMPLFWTAKLLIFLLFIALFASFAWLLFLPIVVRALYSLDGVIYRAQISCTSVGGAFLLTKLKLMAYYEVLRTENKFTFTFGNHSKVDNFWLWQV